MRRPTGIAKDRQLLVEGNDDRNFFEAFFKRLETPDRVQVHDFGGVGGLREFLTGFVRMPVFHAVQSVGIVRDAERSEPAAFQSVQSSLRNAGLPVPSRIGAPSAGVPAVTVLILPGGGRPGMLETILCDTLLEQEVNRCIDVFFECVEALPDIAISNPHKARAYAYLATKPDSHHSVGVAAKAGAWDLSHPVFDDVREFLVSL